MLRIGLSTLRERWVTFAAAFVALTLGSALLATMGLVLAATSTTPNHGPGRYAAAPVVVWVPATLHVPDKYGHIQAQPLAEQPAMPPAVIAKVAAVARVTDDRTFYAQVVLPPRAGGSAPQAGPSDQVGHPWSAAAFAPYKLTGGHAPVSGDQVVISAGGGAEPGEKVTVFTAAGPAAYTVSGVTAPVSFESAVFFTDAEAARLSPRVGALVSYGSAVAVRQAVGNAAQVLTGHDRYKADPRAQQDASTLVGLGTLLSVATLVAGGVSIFLVASTFNFAVAQRRRELALLRAAGATPRQVRRMVFGEAAAVGTVAAVAGCLLGLAGGPLLARWMAGRGLAPGWFKVTLSGPSWIALFIAFVIGLGVAMFGVVAASLRAGQVRPVEALRDAFVDRRAMTIGRWLFGLAALCAGVLTIAAASLVPLVGTELKTYAIAVLLLLAGFSLLSPVVIPSLIRLATWPLARLRGPIGSLARENILAARRRTAATITPVLITVGLAAAVLGVAASISQAESGVTHQQVRAAEYVVTPSGTPGLNQAVVNRVRAIDGIDTAVVAPVTVYATPIPTSVYLEGDIAVLPYSVQAVTPAGLATVMNLPVSAGSPAGLDDHTIIVDKTWNRHVGDTVRLWLADGSEVSLRVTAVLSTADTADSAFVTPRYAGAALPAQIYVRLRPGSSRAAVSVALAAATRDLGARAQPVADWTAAANAKNAEQTLLGLIVILGIAVVYSAIAIVNTLAMATAERKRDLAVLQLAGATRRQVLRVLAAESMLIVLVGVTLAAGVTVITFAGLLSALYQLVGSTPVSVPWVTICVTVAACAVVAFLGSVVPARLALRTRPVELAGISQ